MAIGAHSVRHLRKVAGVAVPGDVNAAVVGSMKEGIESHDYMAILSRILRRCQSTQRHVCNSVGCSSRKFVQIIPAISNTAIRRQR